MKVDGQETSAPEQEAQPGEAEKMEDDAKEAPMKKRGGKRGGVAKNEKKEEKEEKEEGDVGEEKKEAEQEGEVIEEIDESADSSKKPETGKPSLLDGVDLTQLSKPGDDAEVDEIRIELNVEEDCVVSVDPEQTGGGETEREVKSTAKGKRGGYRGKKAPSAASSNNNSNTNNNNNNSTNNNNNASAPPKKKGIFKQATEVIEGGDAMEVEGGTSAQDGGATDADGGAGEKSKTEDEIALRQKVLDEDVAHYEAELERRRQAATEEQERRRAFIGDFNESRVLANRVDYYWAYYEGAESIQALLTWLDPRGVREKDLKKAIQQIQKPLADLYQKRLNTLERSSLESQIAPRAIRSKRINVDVEAQKAVFLYYNNQKNEKK